MIKTTRVSLEALDKSIEKWGNACTALPSDPCWGTLGTYGGCPLCQEHHTLLDSCGECPLLQFTGEELCAYAEMKDFLLADNAVNDDDLPDDDRAQAFTEMQDACRGVVQVLKDCRAACEVSDE